MSDAYFNYVTFWPEDWWGRQNFLRGWRAIYRGDSRLVPPDHLTMARHLHAPTRPGEPTQMAPIYLEALPRRSSQSPSPQAPVVPTAYFEETVAAALVEGDPRPGHETAYLGFLRCVNDSATLERFLDAVLEHAAAHGCTRLVGPTGPLPAWQSGALLDHFHLLPPLHTPYNPPYLPELLAGCMEPWHEQVLFAAETGARTSPATIPGPAQLAAFDPSRLAGDLLPLLVAALGDADLPTPDASAAARLLHWLRAYPLQGWLAEWDGRPAGFVLLQPDLAALVRRSGGGRLWHWRSYAAWRKHARTGAGRLLLGAVAPGVRGRGIGRQLWQQALRHAAAAGWHTITCGPVAPTGTAARFLARQGAQPRQRFMLYALEAW